MEAPKHEKASLPNFLRERECIFHVPFLCVVKIEIDFVSKKSCCIENMSGVEALTKALYRPMSIRYEGQNIILNKPS